MTIRIFAFLAVLLLTAQLCWAQGPARGEDGGLPAALRATLERHPALAAKRAETRGKEALVDSARAQRLPGVSAQAGAQDGANQYPGSLRARQPLWAFGRIDSGIAYAEVDATLGRAELLRSQRQFIDQVAVAYARVLGARERLAVARGNVDALDALHKQIQRREQGQLASVADVRLALARLTQAQAQQERYAGELAVARTELQALTQVRVADELPVPEALVSLPAPGDLESLVLNQSADLQFKQRAVQLARADIERESKAPMPTVYLQADRYLNQPFYGNDVRMAVVIEGNVEGMGQVSGGRVRAAAERLAAAEEDVNGARIEVLRNLRSLLSNRELQEGLLRVQGASRRELVELLASYRRQYEAGQKAWLDVLNMQRELSDLLLQLAQAENDRLIYDLKLAVLSGRLDETAGIAAATVSK